MSKRLLYLLTLICSICLFTACSDDDEKEEIDNSWELVAGTYNSDKLALLYSEDSLPAKEVTFAATNSTNGALTLKNVIPGEATTTISNITVANSEFSGTASTTYADVEYTGSVKDEVMTLKLNVTMKDPNGWAKKYDLADYATGELEYNGHTNPSAVLAGAGYVNYVCVTSTSDFGTSYGAMFRGLFSTLLPQVLNSVTLGADGTITAEYMKGKGISFDQSWIFQSPSKEVAEALFPTSGWLEAPKHLAYWYHKDGKLYIKLDIGNIMAQVMGSGAEDLSGIITQIMTSDPATLKALLGNLLGTEIPVSNETIALIQNWAVNGIPMSVKKENGHTYLYLDKETLDPIMKMNNGSSDLQNIWTMLSTADIIPPEASMASILLSAISTNWDATEAFDLGLDLQ